MYITLNAQNEYFSLESLQLPAHASCPLKYCTIMARIGGPR